MVRPSRLVFVGVRWALGIAAVAFALLVSAAGLPDRWVESALAQVRPASWFMPLAEVRAGMRGYGLTVFRGTTPERFEVEVIDVLHQFRPDQDLILVRTIHPTLVDAPTVGGMSGSPIFLEDRMVGAYAYGWPFGRHPVAGVTPIESMLRELGRTPRPASIPLGPPAAPPAPPAPARPARTALRTLPRGVQPYLGEPLPSLFASTRTASFDAGRGEALTTASTPMLVGGLDPSVAELLDGALRGHGLDVLQVGGGSGGGATPTGARFVDGGALAVTMARGDIASTVVGTVTHVDGDRLIAFGHPMTEAGETGFPTAVARVLHVLASYQRSFKIAEPVAPLGAMIQDRQAAIVVDTTRTASMIPVRIRIRGVPTAQRTEWNFEVARHRTVTPMLIAGAVQSAVKAVAGDVDSVMFSATSRVTLRGLDGTDRSETVEVVDEGFTATGPSAASALGQIRAFDLLVMAFANPFRDAMVDRLEIDLDLAFERRTSEIRDVAVDSVLVDPGEDLDLHVTLRDYNGSEHVRTLRVHIPESAAGHTVSIQVAPANDLEIDRPEPRDAGDLVRTILARPTATELGVSLRLPGRGLRSPGHVLRSAPPSILDAVQATADSDRYRVMTTQLHQRLRTGRVLSGGARLEVTVRSIPTEEP